MPELQQDFTLLTVIQTSTAIAWLVCALAAWLSHHAYKQRTDLIWLAGFLLLALVGAGHAFIASSWADSVGGLGEIEQVRFDLYMSLRLASLELVAAVAVFFMYRRPRVSF